MKNPQTRRRLLATLGFCLAVVLLAGALSAVLTPKDPSMAAFYAEEDHTADVLFIGSSHCMAAFSPTQLWQKTGIPSYNFNSMSQPLWASYYHLKEALRSQTPRVVVLEGFGVSYNNTYISAENADSVSDDYSLALRPGANKLALARAMSKSQVNSRPFYRYAPLLRYHGRWKALTLDDITWPFQDHSSTAKGFAPLYTTEAFSPPRPAPGSGAAMWPAAEAYLRSIIALAEEEGFQLVVALAPYIPEDAEWDIFAQAKALCAEHNVPFIDYLAEEDCGFSYATDMAEHAHVNLKGAEKLTRHMGGYLQETFQLPDRRGDAAWAAWDAAADTESWEQERARLRLLSPTATEFFAHLQDEHFLTFAVTRGDALPKGREGALLRSALADKGIDAIDPEQDLLFVLRGGTLLHAEQGRAPAFRWEGEGVAAQLAAGPEARLLLNGEAVQLDYDGLLVAVYDTKRGDVLHSVAFCPDEGYITRTD